MQHLPLRDMCDAVGKRKCVVQVGKERGGESEWKTLGERPPPQKNDVGIGDGEAAPLCACDGAGGDQP